VRTDSKTFLFNPDGTGRTEVAAVAAPIRGQLSPDAASVLSVSDQAIHVADVDGKNSRKISPDNVVAAWPVWSPDGRRIAFLAIRGQLWQVHLMDRDGGNVRQLTDGPCGAWKPKFGSDGRLAYLSWHKREGKLQPADLLIFDGRNARAVVKKVFINDYAWSLNGKTIVYSKFGALVFHELATGAEQEVAFPDIDKQMVSHAASQFCWRPDSQAVASSITFLGDRQEGGPKIFGDDELFVIPRRGKASWFRPGEKVEQIEWIKQPGPEK
jgi:Tol biopolymer transport system component